MRRKIAIISQIEYGAELARAVEEVSDPDDVTRVVVHVIQREDWVLCVGDVLRIVELPQ